MFIRSAVIGTGRLLLCAGCLLVWASAAAWSQGAPLATVPYWESPEPNATRSVAVGDVDLDGDLDVVFGNAQQANALFLNLDGVLGISSAWLPAGADLTRSVALGDVDGDGDLDLVCGNFGGRNTVYRNEGGMLGTVPSDTLETVNTGEIVVLGDVDNDGDLDVVIGVPLFPNAVFLNESGSFPGPPMMIGGSTETRGLALGDIDRNGYLDLVECNVTGSPPENYVYLNDGGVFAAAPAWVSDPGYQTLDVELADINGDGWLDLICANLGQANTIYYGGMATLLDTIPSWESGPALSSTDVDVGDVDNDGDLDLMFANSLQPNHLYRNNLSDPDVTALSTSPVWSSDQSNRTIAVVFADLDADGNLEVVCGNSAQLNTAYLNLTPPLETSPVWESILPALNRTKSVALGDTDNDGDLDLVCGNGGAGEEVNTFYRNDGGRFETAPSWSSAEARRTSSVVLGDIHRDDRIDAVFGSQGITGEPNELYENNGGPFTQAATWASQLRKVTTAVALGDINGDGFVDLVCGNGADSSTVYLNLGTTFDTMPAWRSGLAQNTSGIALGDIDGDGDLDLACGNNGERNTVFLNDGTGLAALPNWSSSLGLFTNDVALGDIDGDGDLDLVCANNPQANTVYFNESGALAQSAGWSSRPPARATTSVALGDLDGDGDLDLVCGNEQFQPNTAYLNEGGVLDRSPGWISDVMYDTEDVALGDVDGDGDLDAVFGNENAPNTLYLGTKNPAYRGDPMAPTNNQTNNPACMTDIEVRRTGPNEYRIVFSLVDIESDPVWVLAEYQFAGEPTWYPATVNGNVARVGPFASSAAAIRDSLEWDTSQVPSDTRDIVLRLATIEVPSRVSVVRHAPSYQVNIGTIPLVDSFARPGSGSEFFNTRDILIELRLPPGVTRQQAHLYYRRGGEREYQEAGFGAGSPLPVAVISSDWVTERGIEYWVEVNTATETLTDPRTTPAEHPHAIRVTVTNLTESRRHPGGAYRLMSIPLELESPVSILRVLQDDIGFPDARRWRLYADDAAESTYVEVPNDTVLAFEPGRGYWLITRDAHRIDTAPVFGKSAPTDRPFLISLQPGWNLIGHPYGFPVSWAATGVDVAAVEPPVAFRDGGYVYDVEVLEPWEAYWVRNRTGATYPLGIPADEWVGAGAASGVAAGKRPGSENGWSLRLSVSADGAVDSDNVVGVNPGSGSEWDARDRSEAPMGPGPSLALYFPHRGGRYTRDIRGRDETLDDARIRALGAPLIGTDLAGHLWRFDIAKNFATIPAGDAMALEFIGVDDIPDGSHVLLIDLELARVIDLRHQHQYEFYQGRRGYVSGENETRFALLVGNDAFADSRENELVLRPERTALRGNRPNPFNPVTIIRYEIAATAPVTVQIYDATGTRVRELYAGTREPGIYDVTWRGMDDAGRPVASGIYFCRLMAGNVTDTRKLLLLK